MSVAPTGMPLGAQADGHGDGRVARPWRTGTQCRLLRLTSIAAPLASKVASRMLRRACARCSSAASS